MGHEKIAMAAVQAQRLSECDVYAVGGTLLLWFSCAVLLVYLPNVAWYAYGVKTTPDVGWSWEVLYPLISLFSLGIWWLILFTRPGVKVQFLQQSDFVEPEVVVE